MGVSARFIMTVLQLSNAIQMKSPQTNTYPTRFLPYRRYPKSYSYPHLARVPLQRSHTAIFDRNVLSASQSDDPHHDYNLLGDSLTPRSLLLGGDPMVRTGPIPAPSGPHGIVASHGSDAGSPMQSVRSPSVDCEDFVRGYLDGGLEPLTPVHEVVPPRLTCDNEHIRHLMGDVRRSIHRATYAKRRLARQYDMIDVALCDEIESKINIAIGLALKDTTDRSDVAVSSSSMKYNSPPVGNHQADVPNSTVSAGVLQDTVRWVTKAAWCGSLGVVRFSGQRVCAALSSRKPITFTTNRMYAIPGEWKEATPPL